ncbi:deoxyribodipyrimidine photo-lyase [Chryseobacterium sp. SORGH_AS 447]|uniref:DASH family cryptochrome n=1 Tax=Chryseobacterium sp. SORGH_AS_0447 TaxID=3041769 RepID=UPI00277E1363|nr:DASH family cryptochrome [Chryseobacterium sp. SORGH_AS_0447]MDQ1161590.1 deoxyribodipyrimidine photo-lyase [Chryseobacterium sp. SORGH_AS_0447]
MSEKQKINILWLTKDLRTRDSESLYKIMQEGLPFLAVYVFEDLEFKSSQFGSRKTGKYRAKFLMETVEDLKNNFTRKNIPFLIKIGNTATVFKELTDRFEITKIFCQEEWTQEELIKENEIREVLPSAVWEKSYSQFLVHPLFVFKTIEKIPMLFTAFRQKIEKNLLIRPEFNTEHLGYERSGIEVESNEISLELLGYDGFETDKRSAFPFRGGETEGLKRVESYFLETRNLSRYKETRNGLIGDDYSSKFSAWLADGSLSAVTVYHEIKKYEQQFGSNESTYWLVFELLWRDFFRYVSMEYKDLIFWKNGISRKKYTAEYNEELIRSWKDGATDSDFINANMLELKNTGWMSNRGRQNVASYFCKVLKQDWRIGAAYFEELLIDYDVHSNYGNWMYLAGVGNDNRDRIFNPEKQAEVYDPNHEFTQLWLQN